MNITTHSERETQQFAQQRAKKLKGGEILGLIGELGAGKTAFVKGLAKGLGVKQRINSPTFVVMKVYPVKHKIIKQLVHVDAYRVKKAQALTAIGLGDYIKAKDTVVVIEWADLVRKMLPKKSMIISFLNINEKNRTIIL